MNWYKKWRLRRAKEKHACAAARYESLRETWAGMDRWARSDWERNKLANAAGTAARYEERVEILMRDN